MRKKPATRDKKTSSRTRGRSLKTILKQAQASGCVVDHITLNVDGSVTVRMATDAPMTKASSWAEVRNDATYKKRPA